MGKIKTAAETIVTCATSSLALSDGGLETALHDKMYEAKDH